MVGIHIASSVRNQRENAGALFLCPCHLCHHTHNCRLLFKPIICQFLKCFIIYVCKCASGFRCPWSWIEGGCEQPTWVWELTWLLCKSRQRSSLLSHFSSLPTSPFYSVRDPNPWSDELRMSISVPQLKLWKQAPPRSCTIQVIPNPSKLTEKRSWPAQQATFWLWEEI